MAEDGVCVLSWGWNPPVAAWKSERSVPPGVGPGRAPQRGAEGGAGAPPRGGPAPGTALRRRRRARALARGVRPGQQGAPEWREGNCRSASGRFPARSRYLPRGRALAPLSPPQSPSARPLPAGSWSGAAQRQPSRPRPARPPRRGAGVRRCRGPAQAPRWARPGLAEALCVPSVSSGAAGWRPEAARGRWHSCTVSTRRPERALPAPEPPAAVPFSRRRCSGPARTCWRRVRGCV